MSKKHAVITIGSAVLLVLAVLLIIPFFFDGSKRVDPPSVPVSEASRFLGQLYLLEKEYFADNGRYAPDPDAKICYKEGDTGIRRVLPAFNPGKPEDLFFDYILITEDTGRKFLATATGKRGTDAEREMYYINQDYSKNW